MSVAASVGTLLGGSVAAVGLAIAVRRREVVEGLLSTQVQDAAAHADSRPKHGERYLARASMPLALIACSAAGAAFGWTMLGLVGALVGALGGPVLVRVGVRRRATRRQELLEDQFRDALAAIAAGVRAGLSVRRALEEAARESEAPLAPVLEAAMSRLEVGETLDSVVASLAESVSTPDASLLVTLLAIHRRAGGDLPGMLDELASISGQRRGVRRELRALTAQGRTSGAVLAVLPIAFVTLLSWTGGDGLGDFYRTSTGSLLLLVGMALELLGFLWISRLLRVRSVA